MCGVGWDAGGHFVSRAYLRCEPDRVTGLRRERVLLRARVEAPPVPRAHHTMHTTITRQQLADLLSGIGSCYLSGGGYDGDAALAALGAIAQALAEHVRLGPTETYEIPPVRA